MHFVERLTFSFDEGTFSFAFRDLPWKGFDDVADVSVENTTGSALDFTTTFQPQANGDWHIRWSYPATIAPAVRTFVLRYTLTNALLQPSATLNRIDWLAVGTGWNVFTRNVTVDVSLPGVVDRTRLAYSPAPFRIAEAQGHTVLSFAYANLPAFTSFRVIVDFPKVTDVNYGIARIARESPIAAGVVSFAIALAAMIVLWVIIGRERKGRDSFGGASWGPPPSTLVPEEVAFLLRQTLDVPGMLAAVLGLAVKGYVVVRGAPSSQAGYVSPSELIELTELGKAEISRRDDSGGDLLPSQRTLLQALTSRIDPLQAMYGTRKILMRAIGDRLATAGLLAGSPSIVRRRYVLGATLIGIATTVFGLASLYSAPFYSFLGIYAGLFGGAIAVASVGYFMPRATEEGATQRALWERFLAELRERIEHLSESDPREALRVLDQYLPFVPLTPGIEMPRWMRSLARRMPDIPYHPIWYQSYPWWIVPGQGPPSSASNVNVAQAVSHDFSNFANSFATTLGHFETYMAPSGGGAG